MVTDGPWLAYSSKRLPVDLSNVPVPATKGRLVAVTYLAYCVVGS